MPPTLYADVLAKNVRAARSRADLQQEPLAARMRALGYEAWQRQTVANVERGKRRVTAEEILGLAICLETSIVALMAPVNEDKVVDLPSGEQLSVTAVQMLARGLSDIGVTWYDNKPVLNAPAASVERFREVFGGGA